MRGRKVLVIGKGGREAALAWKLSQSAHVFVAPGNAGTTAYAENIDIQPTDIKALVTWAKANDIYLTVVGPDDPLAMGVVNAFKQAGLRVFGPTAGAARIEASKAFAKDLMAKAGIPTAAYQTFSAFSPALRYVRHHGAPIVIKASGLALGKGAFVCATLDEAERALRLIMVDKAFGESGKTVVIEELLEGPELSVHALSDGKTSLLFPPSQDYKRIGDGDTGANTGGIGAVMPLPWVGPGVMTEVKRTIVDPALAALTKAGHPYVGCLYPGLMMTKTGLRVLEFNGRFGDPECELYMLMLQNDLLELLDACVDGTLHEQKLAWKPGFAACVVMCSAGYPGDYKSGVPITIKPDAPLSGDAQIFHAGTKLDADGRLVTAGGRVLMVTTRGDTLMGAIDRAYDLADYIEFDGEYLRTDIGVNTLSVSVSS